MLWLALHFHSLSLEVFSRGAAVPDPLAVVEKQGSRTWVIACNDAAAACASAWPRPQPRPWRTA